MTPSPVLDRTPRPRIARRPHLLPAGVLLIALSAGAASGSIPPWERRETKRPVYAQALVSAQWLARNLGARGVRVVDVRPLERFRSGHIPGALHLDAAALAPDPGSLGARFAAAGVPARGTVVCYGDRDGPAAAGRLYWLLELAGHRGARVLDGGLEAWQAARRPIGRGARAARPARFDLAPDTTRLADFRYVMESFASAGHTVMDWRSPEAWAAGHIPHSLPFPLERLVRGDGTLLDSLRARAVFETFGPRENDHVNLDDEFIVCGDLAADGAPVHPYLAARLAGIARVRCYPEGFAGWERHAEAPRVRVVDAREVARLLGAPADDAPARGIILLDLRGQPDYDIGHLPGALWLPTLEFDRALEDTLRARWPDADRASIPMILYCYGPGCVRSRNGATIAAQHGFRNLLWFRDGTMGWRDAGLEVVKTCRE